MKVNARYFSFPPFVALTWDAVGGLYTVTLGPEQFKLCVLLKTGQTIELPPIEKQTALHLFAAFGQYQEQQLPPRRRSQSRGLHLPPHIAITWDLVSGLQAWHQKQGEARLLLHLTSGQSVQLPSIDQATCDQLFEAFQRYQTEAAAQPLKPITPTLEMSGELQLLEPSSSQERGEELSRSLRHNPELAHLPLLPREVLERIASAARLLFSVEEGERLPQPTAGCHCLYCQIARAIQGGLEQAIESFSEEDLRFGEWHVERVDEDHYRVTSYSEPGVCHEVHLKPQLSCSCGSSGCDHIAAVLRT